MSLAEQRRMEALRPVQTPVARYVPSYASPEATARQETINRQAPGVPAATPRLPSTTGTRDVPNLQAPAPSQAAAPRGPMDYRDSAYNSQIAAIQRALQDFETGAQTRGERYGQDFTTGLNRLGYRPGEGFQAMPNILEALSARQMGDGADGEMGVSLPEMGGSFDIEGQFDPFTAAARGTRGMRDEFAGRGTLRSSDFAQSFGEFQNRLNQQLEAMETGRTRFGQDLATDVTRERSATEDRMQAARRDAMMRAAVGAAGMGGF